MRAVCLQSGALSHRSRRDPILSTQLSSGFSEVIITTDKVRLSTGRSPDWDHKAVFSVFECGRIE